MNLPDANARPTDRYLKQLLQESYDQKSKHEIWSLPCGHGNTEITQRQDMWIQCNTCQKKYQLMWSAVNKKVREIV